ncbi:hypothetical protein FSP39_006391 [Pinctada imbricata]|uniref:B box-type domain-containing protein n=1 Tax=Pinctada imbricata TaxID=66713 RepID=A0AA88XVM3_PINIB|nr:hypothetical protein FSP39_006391 [Pinctada imbricata]
MRGGQGERKGEEEAGILREERGKGRGRGGKGERGSPTMSDNGATAFPTQLVLTCGFCSGTNDVKWFCKSCAASMCNTCKTSHPTIPAFKNHVIVLRTNDVIRLYRSSKIAAQCPIHPEKEISTYCKDCEEPCCVKCLYIYI